MSYGNTETWKIVYTPSKNSGCTPIAGTGVALVEATDRQSAMFYFMNDYSGEYSVINRCEKLF